MPISHTLHTESTLRIHWFPHHHTFLPRRTVATENKSIRRLPIIINLLKFVVLSSLRCLVPVRISISIVVSTTLVTTTLPCTAVPRTTPFLLRSYYSCITTTTACTLYYWWLVSVLPPAIQFLVTARIRTSQPIHNVQWLRIIVLLTTFLYRQCMLHILPPLRINRDRFSS